MSGDWLRTELGRWKVEVHAQAEILRAIGQPVEQPGPSEFLFSIGDEVVAVVKKSEDAWTALIHGFEWQVKGSHRVLGFFSPHRTFSNADEARAAVLMVLQKSPRR